MSTGSRELDGFIARYSREVEAQMHAAIGIMRRQLPSANLLVYDNYNALAVGFGATEKASDVIVSIAAYPRWVSLFFLHGAELDDPHKLLGGSGRQVRSIRLVEPEMLNHPDMQALLATAIAKAKRPLDSNGPGKILIKSISAKQRPRRPVGQ
ncbi:DUF1801 domain-containing protein [Aquisediminimonas profunda]|uniref:DUF1801 domain-containing protein n=1 Tax=Aquisediminimonas profunda TaxID=1550733 RepID=UPI001C62F055|nr:DUF1801 domain-containing protein [Aquisediminimonas profunda]